MATDRLATNLGLPLVAPVGLMAQTSIIARRQTAYCRPCDFRVRKVPLGQIDVHEARLAYGDLKVDTKLGPMKKIARTIQSCLTNVVHYCPHSITPAVG